MCFLHLYVYCTCGFPASIVSDVTKHLTRVNTEEGIIFSRGKRRREVVVRKICIVSCQTLQHTRQHAMQHTLQHTLQHVVLKTYKPRAVFCHSLHHTLQHTWQNTLQRTLQHILQHTVHKPHKIWFEREENATEKEWQNQRQRQRETERDRQRDRVRQERNHKEKTHIRYL